MFNQRILVQQFLQDPIPNTNNVQQLLKQIVKLFLKLNQTSQTSFINIAYKLSKYSTNEDFLESTNDFRLQFVCAALSDSYLPHFDPGIQLFAQIRKQVKQKKFDADLKSQNIVKQMISTTQFDEPTKSQTQYTVEQANSSFVQLEKQIENQTFSGNFEQEFAQFVKQLSQNYQIVVKVISARYLDDVSKKGSFSLHVIFLNALVASRLFPRDEAQVLCLLLIASYLAQYLTTEQESYLAEFLINVQLIAKSQAFENKFTQILRQIQIVFTGKILGVVNCLLYMRLKDYDLIKNTEIELLIEYGLQIQNINHLNQLVNRANNEFNNDLFQYLAGQLLGFSTYSQHHLRVLIKLLSSANDQHLQNAIDTVSQIFIGMFQFKQSLFQFRQVVQLILFKNQPIFTSQESILSSCILLYCQTKANLLQNLIQSLNKFFNEQYATEFTLLALILRDEETSMIVNDLTEQLLPFCDHNYLLSQMLMQLPVSDQTLQYLSKETDFGDAPTALLMQLLQYSLTNNLQQVPLLVTELEQRSLSECIKTNIKLQFLNVADQLPITSYNFLFKYLTLQNDVLNQQQLIVVKQLEQQNFILNWVSQFLENSQNCKLKLSIVLERFEVQKSVSQEVIIILRKDIESLDYITLQEALLKVCQEVGDEGVWDTSKRLLEARVAQSMFTQNLQQLGYVIISPMFAMKHRRKVYESYYILLLQQCIKQYLQSFL